MVANLTFSIEPCNSLRFCTRGCKTACFLGSLGLCNAPSLPLPPLPPVPCCVTLVLNTACSSIKHGIKCLTACVMACTLQSGRRPEMASSNYAQALATDLSLDLSKNLAPAQYADLLSRNASCENTASFGSNIGSLPNGSQLNAKYECERLLRVRENRSDVKGVIAVAVGSEVSGNFAAPEGVEYPPVKGCDNGSGHSGQMTLLPAEGPVIAQQKANFARYLRGPGSEPQLDNKVHGDF